MNLPQVVANLIFNHHSTITIIPKINIKSLYQSYFEVIFYEKMLLE